MTTIDEEIKRQEKHLAICNAIKEKFPKAKVTGLFGSKNFYFSSSEVNSIFTFYEIDKTNSWLKIKPYIIIELSIFDEIIPVKIHTKPYTCTLAEITRYPKKQSIMRFKKFSQRNSVDHFLNFCQEEILKYIKENADVYLDKTNLNPEIKKFLAFA